MVDFQSLYSEAVQEYEAGHYDRAHDLFCNLSMELPMQPDVWKGLASCNQVRKHYPEALIGWSMAALLDANDPVPHFHAAECLLAKGDRIEALKAVRIALGLPCPEELLDQIVRLKEVIDNV